MTDKINGTNGTGRIKVLVVDDELLARRRLLRFLRSESDAELVDACSNGPDAIAAIRRHHPDVLLLDIQMPEVDGFEVLASLEPEERPHVIFVTAYDEYAVRAFEIHALDYLLKPFGSDRFREAFQRVRDELRRDAAERQRRLATYLEEQPSRGEAAARPRYLDRLMIKSGGRVFFVKVSDIDWIEAADNYVRLHCGRDTHLIRETLNSVEANLDPTQFARIHRSSIVNLDRVQEMHQGVSRGYIVLLKNGTRLKLSPWYRDRLEERMRTSA
jgi:two-component system LytT family response regulator